MKSVILEKGEKYYTYMMKVFQSIENRQMDYNWLITNCECYPQNEKINELFSQEYIWITGEQLTEIISKEDFQFIWGVFSGFTKEFTLEDVLKYDFPFADGYEGFWTDNVGIQHPLADIEIVAWDSSLTLFISKNEYLVQKFMEFFPFAKDLSVQNIRHNSQISHIQELLTTELIKRNMVVSEKTLHIKYTVWRNLYANDILFVSDGDISKCICDTLNKIS